MTKIMAPRLAPLLFVLLAAAFASAPARAADKKSKEAIAAATHAMDELFSSAKFTEARDSLEATLADCAACSPQAQATIHVDLAIVYITGLRSAKKGAAEMKLARSLDPALQLDPAFTTPEIQAAYAAAGGAAGAQPGGGTSGGATPQDVVLEDETDDDEKPKKKKRHHVEEEDEAPPPPECTRDADCQAGSVCQAGACVVPPPPRERHVWLSLGLIQDFAFRGGSNVCTRQNQVNNGYTCMRTVGGTEFGQYHGTPAPGAGGSLSGPGLGPTRLTLATDFTLGSSLSAGIRIGYAVAGGSPVPDGGKRFVPSSEELHFAYHLGKALSAKKVTPFFEASVGAAQLVGQGETHVTEATGVAPPINQIDNPPTQKLNVYQNAGLGFAGIGAGLFVPFGSAVALVTDLRFSLFFPTSGFAMSLGAGLAFGL